MHDTRWSKLIARVTGLLLALVALAGSRTGPAAAHQPLFNDAGSPSIEQPFVIDNPAVSLAVSGALREAGALDVYRLDVSAGHELSFRLMVPETCPAFAPHLVFMGPDVTDDMSALPRGLALPPIAGAYTVTADEWPSFYESHGDVTYRLGPSITHTSRVGGTYYVAVYDWIDRTGTYLLSMGGSEQLQAVPNWRERKGAYDRCELSAGITTPPPAKPAAPRPLHRPLPVMAFASVAAVVGAWALRRRSFPPA